MKNNKIYLTIRILFFILISAGLILQITVLRGESSFVNIFFYFTIQSNFFVTVYLAFSIIKSKIDHDFYTGPLWIQGGITMNIVITGIIFHLLLSKSYQPAGLAGLVNFVIHTAAPVFFLVDWLLTQKRGSYRIKEYLLWLIYPVCYLILGSIEGAVTGIFRYPFMDFLHQAPGQYIVSILFVSLSFFLMGGVMLFINRKFNPGK